MTQQESILVNTVDGRKYIHLTEILFIEAKGKRTELILDNSSLMLANHCLKWFQDNLPEEYFIRIHRSFIVNKTHIKSFTAIMITMDHKQVVSIGRCYKREFAVSFHLVD